MTYILKYQNKFKKDKINKNKKKNLKIKLNLEKFSQ